MEKINVEGLAIEPCISRNRVKYIAEELKKFAPTLKGRPILLDHFASVENSAGLVVKTKFDDGKVMFEGWVTDTERVNVVERIKDKRVKEVSISGICKKMVRENDDDDFVVAIGIEALELSLIVIPGVKTASIKPKEEFNDLTDEELDEIESSLNKKNEESIKVDDSKPKIKEDVIMVEEEPKDKVPVSEEPEGEEQTTPDISGIVEKAVTLALERANENFVKLLAEQQKKVKEEPVTEPVVETVAEPVKEKTDFQSVETVDEPKTEAFEGYVIEKEGKELSFWRMPNSDGTFSKRGE